MAAAVALLSPSAHAASTITIAVSPAVANAIADMVTDFVSTTDAIPNATGGTGLGYSVSLQVVTDAEAEAGIITAEANGGTDLPDLFLSQSTAVPSNLILKGLTLDDQLINYAKDSLVLYSGAEKQLNIKTSLSTHDSLDTKKLLLSSLKFSIPDPAINDPYGLAAKKVLGPIYPLLGKFLLKTPDAVTSYVAVENVAKADGGTDFGFTGLSQICSAVTGVQEFEPGSLRYVFPSAFDVQLAGVKIANNFNQTTSPTYSPQQYQELIDFVDFLTGTPLGIGAKTGQDTLAQHCYH